MTALLEAAQLCPSQPGSSDATAFAFCPPEGEMHGSRLKNASHRSGVVGGHSQDSPRSSCPKTLHGHLGSTWTTLQTTPSCSLMNQSVINTRRLFRFAGSMLNIHVKEQKHTECKCLHSSKLRGHIYILIVENYKANWRRRTASPLTWHAADYAQASSHAGERGHSRRPSRYSFSRNEN